MARLFRFRFGFCNHGFQLLATIVTNEQSEENCRQITRKLSPWIDPLDADERRALDRFCRLVEELEGHKIFRDLLQPGRIDWRLKIEDGKVVSAHIEKLDETELGAFVPLARLFTQKREHSSIRKVAAIFDKRASERHPIWWNFNAYRVGLQQFLALTAPNLTETFGEIFDVFMNGHYVHREDPKEARYESWKKDVGGFTSRKVAFLLAVSAIVSHASSIRNYAKQLLEVTANPPVQGSTKKVVNLPAGLTKALFSDEIVSLDPKTVDKILDGERIAVSEQLINHLLDFLGHDLAPHIHGGRIGEIKLHEYGVKVGSEWIDKKSGASLVLPVSWMSIEKTSGETAVKNYRGKPIVFATQEFFSHLKRVDEKTHRWELVL
jgi:hypothetical protein